jgi:HK97 family phage major capsid protein
LLSLYLFLRALAPVRWLRMKRAQHQAAAFMRQAKRRYAFTAGLQARGGAAVADSRTRDLTYQKRSLVKEAHDILDIAEAEDRDLTQEEENRWTDLNKEIDEIDKRTGRYERIHSLEATMSRSRGTSAAGREPVETTTAPAGEPTKPDPQAEARAAFRKFLAHGYAPLSAVEQRALQMDSDVVGGFLVAPQDFVTRLIKFIDDFVYIRQLATTIPVTNAESLGVPTLDTDPSDSDWTAEIATGSEDSALRVGKRELRPHPLAKRIKISNKLLRTSTMDPEALVVSRLGYKFAITQEKAFMTGSGTEQPLGLFTASSVGIDTSRDVSTGNTTTAIGADGLIEAKFKLKVPYWTRGVWLFHRDAVKQIRKLKDGNGQYLWQSGIAGARVGDITAGIPNTILDQPYYISEYVPNTFTTGLYVGLFGDLSFYWIADALSLQIQRLIELYAEANQVGLIGRLETDGMPTLAEAFARVQLA